MKESGGARRQECEKTGEFARSISPKVFKKRVIKANTSIFSLLVLYCGVYLKGEKQHVRFNTSIYFHKDTV